MNSQEPTPLAWETFLKALPPDWHEEDLRSQAAAHNQHSRRCVVALDDDPTGTQTVHDIWVLTVFDRPSLAAALQDGEPALYILTNTRSLPEPQAQALVRSAAQNLIGASREVGRPITVVSRSDSTLRGHFPAETDALEQVFAQAGEGRFDGLCLVPAFPEGGRYTAGDVHWVRSGDLLTPAAQTPFARDAVFGYAHSRLPDWVEEKTQGRVRAGQVASISLKALRLGGPAEVAQRLLEVSGGQVVVVNAVTYRDLDVFVAGLQQAEAQGKRFLFRTAAAFVKAAAGISDRPLLARQELLDGVQPGAGGLVVFGSHVPLSTAQLERLKGVPELEMVEFPAGSVLEEGQRQIAVEGASLYLNRLLAQGRDAVLYTSREVLTGEDPAASLQLAAKVSASLVEIVLQLNIRPRFVIGKGGITSSDLATGGLNIKAARVLGQVYPGVPVWKTGPGSRWPGMNYIVFPGNVGESDTLANIVRMLR